MPAFSPPHRGMLQAPADAGAIASHIRACSDPTVVFRWFRRLLLLEGAYRHRDLVAVDGDVIRKAIESSAAVGVDELAALANSSSGDRTTLVVFVAACLLVTGRADGVADRKPAAYAAIRSQFQKAVALLFYRIAIGNLQQAQIFVSEKNYLAILLRTAGYPDLAFDIGRHMAWFGRVVRTKVDGNAFRTFTDRWSFAIGHIVVLAYLARAQQAGLTEYRGIRLWKGFVANDYLLGRVAALSERFEIVPPFAGFGDTHSVNQPEWFEGAYRNYFDTCGLIADRVGDGTGAILPRPTPDEPAVAAFLEAAGLRPDDRIVTLHCRESAFKRDSRHDLRNVDIASCLPAIRLLVDRGFKVVRLGDRSTTPLPPMPGVVDYAQSALKSRELDVLLPGIARVHIGSSSGLSLVPLLFGTPCLFLNWYPMDMMPWGRRTWTVLRPLHQAGAAGPLADPAPIFRFGSGGSPTGRRSKPAGCGPGPCRTSRSRRRCGCS